MTIWDPVSKQPQLKTAAVKVESVRMRIGPFSPTCANSSPPAAELRAAAERHRVDHDVFHQCHTFAASRRQARAAASSTHRRYDGSD